MRTIDPSTIYSAEEVGKLLLGCVKIETLRKEGGLVGLPGAGYWGADLILAINTMQAKRRASRGHEREPTEQPAERAKVNGQPKKASPASRPVENQRTKFRRLIEMQKKEKAAP